MRRRRGSSILEAALFVPILFLLLMGAVELARVGYTYFVLQKVIYSLARYLGTQQGVNFCDDADASIVAAKNFALTGTTDGSADSILPNLSADMISVRAEKSLADSDAPSLCTCDASGCDAAQGATGPDFLVVSITDGYSMRLGIPFMAQADSFLLRPQVRVPFGGT